MSISGISGSSPSMGYVSRPQHVSINTTNNQVQSVGKQNTREIAKVGNDRSRVSNFGTETRIGSSRVYKGNVQAIHLSEQSMSRATDQLYSNVGGSKFGTETKIGTGRIFDGNTKAIQLGAQSISRAADQVHSNTDSSQFGTDTKIGTSRVYKGNARAIDMGKQSMSESTQKMYDNYEQMLKQKSIVMGIGG